MALFRKGEVCVHVCACGCWGGGCGGRWALECVQYAAMSVCVRMRLKGGRDVKMDGVCVCVDLFDNADPIFQPLH